jgi:hypothetical protein
MLDCHVVGGDLNAMLRIGTARGYDLAVLSELLPAAEAGLVEALYANADRPPLKLEQATNVRWSAHCRHCDARRIPPNLTSCRH